VSKFALPRVGGIISNRESKIENDLAEAQKLKDESDQALKAYETELADARARAQAIGSETRDKLNAQAESDRKALESALATKLADAEKTIASTRSTAMGNVRSIASDAATAIVQRLTGVAPDGKAVESAVDASLKG
jgi:F-type H+-transporting ATPase subunit b